MNFDNQGDRLFNLPFLKKIHRSKHPHKKELRIPGIGFLPNKLRNHIIAFIGEFVGTFLFLFFAFSGTQVANAAASGADTQQGGLSQIPNASTLLYISLVFGFSLAVNAWVFFRVSGGLFNPAVTLGMALIGAVKWVRAGVVVVAQLLGSMASAGLVSALFPGPMNVSTTLGGNTSIAQGVFIEMFTTAMLIFTIFMLAAEKHKGTFLAPVGIGLALFIAELSSVYFTGGSLNPARSFGPCVVLHLFPGYHWIYWVGPFMGSLLAVIFYRFIKTLEYETANPGQDFNDQEAEVFQFDEENAATGADVARPNPEDLRVLSSEQVSQIPGVGGRAGRVNSNLSEGMESRMDMGDGIESRLESSDGPQSSQNEKPSYEVIDPQHHPRGTRDFSAGGRGRDRNVSTFSRASDAERGELGGSYTVSGLRQSMEGR